MVTGQNRPEARDRDSWLVPQIVLTLLLVAGLIILLLWVFVALTDGGQPAPELEDWHGLAEEAWAR